MDDRIAEIGRLIATQDNRSTAAPIFAVQERRRIYGMDPAYADDDEIAWIDCPYEGGEIDGAERAAVEAEYEETGEEPDGYTRTAYIDVWEFVTACFTEQGCKDFIAANGHNLTDPRIYAYGSYRNYEWQDVRDHLLQVGQK